jgi:hypothetical protein
MSILQDTESDASPQALYVVGELIIDLESRRRWLNERSTEMQRLFDRMFFRLGALADKAEWDSETLLVELGCRKRTSTHLQALTETELARCAAFFAWIRDLGREAPTSPMIMRALISTAAGMYADAGQDLGACQRAMQQTLGPDDAVAAIDLLRLGEIGGAFRGAVRALPGAAGNEARAAAATNPFARGHVPATTLDAWLTDSDSLAIEQRARLDTHISGCELCHDAADHRAVLLGVGERPPPVLATPATLMLR